MENVLVTGGAGFIGSHLVKALINRDDIGRVVVVDNLSMSNLNYINLIRSPKLDFVEGDVANYDLMSLLVNRYCVSTVFHLATSPLVFSLKDPQLVIKNIMGMQQAVLECQRKVFFKN